MSHTDNYCQYGAELGASLEALRDFVDFFMVAVVGVDLPDLRLPAATIERGRNRAVGDYRI